MTCRSSRMRAPATRPAPSPMARAARSPCATSRTRSATTPAHSIASADGGLADASTLVGSGVPGKPVVTVTPDEHEFDPVVVGDAPEVQDFTVRNTGDATLTRHRHRDHRRSGIHGRDRRRHGLRGRGDQPGARRHVRGVGPVRARRCRRQVGDAQGPVSQRRQRHGQRAPDRHGPGARPLGLAIELRLRRRRRRSLEGPYLHGDQHRHGAPHRARRRGDRG